jgi:hypothetical protein
MESRAKNYEAPQRHATVSIFLSILLSCVKIFSSVSCSPDTLNERARDQSFLYVKTKDYEINGSNRSQNLI